MRRHVVSVENGRSVCYVCGLDLMEPEERESECLGYPAIRDDETSVERALRQM